MKRLLTTVALLAAFVASACGRGEQAAPKPRPAVELLLGHLPPDTDAVVAGSLTELARWPLWRRAVGVITHETRGVAERIATTCRLDPWTMLDHAALAFTSELDNTVLAAATTVNRVALHKCATDVGSDMALAVEDGPITKYQQAEGTEYASWTGDRLFLVVPQRMDEVEALQALEPTRPVPQALQSLIARADRTATVWGVALASGDGLVAGLVSSMPLATKPIGVHAAIRRTDSLRVQLALVFADASAVADAVRLLEQGLAMAPPPVDGYRDAIKIEAHGDEARVMLQLDGTRAKQLDEQVSAMLPVPTKPPPPRSGSNVPPPPP